MRRLMAASAAAVFLVSLVAGTALAGEAKGGETTISGYITDSHCKGDGAKEGHKDCAMKCVEKGAKLGVWDAASGKFYTLDDQKKAGEFAGMSVTVKGTVDEATGMMKVSGIAKAEKKSS